MKKKELFEMQEFANRANLQDAPFDEAVTKFQLSKDIVKMHPIMGCIYPNTTIGHVITLVAQLINECAFICKITGRDNVFFGDSFALYLQGCLPEGRIIEDIDLIIPIENSETYKLKEALTINAHNMGFAISNDYTSNSFYHYLDLNGKIKVNWVFVEDTDKVFEYATKSRYIIYDEFGYNGVYVTPVEDILAIKGIWGRTKDIKDIQEVTALLKKQSEIAKEEI